MNPLRQTLITSFCVALISACSSGSSNSNPPVTTSGPAAINLTNMPTITGGVVSAMLQTSEFDNVLAGGGKSGGLFGKVRPGDGFSKIAGSLLGG